MGPWKVAQNAARSSDGTAQLTMLPASDHVSRQESRDRQARRPQDWSPAEKFEAVLQAGRLSEEELGA